MFLQTWNLVFKSFIQNTSGQLLLQLETQQQFHLLKQSQVHSFLEKDISDFITHFSFKFLITAKKKTKIKKKKTEENSRRINLFINFYFKDFLTYACDMIRSSMKYFIQKKSYF